METYRVLRIEEQLYGCEELPEGQPVLCDVLLENAAGERRVLPYPDAELTALDINEGDTIALTEKGRAQAAQLGEAVKNSGIVLDEILYSPLSRAADTALAVAAATGLPARVEPRLREQCFGRFEGTSPRNSPEFTAAKMQFADRYTDGESMLQLAQRIYNLLDELKQDDKTYLLVAHNGIARVVESYFYNMTNAEYAAFGIKNCELRKFDFDE